MMRSGILVDVAHISAARCEHWLARLNCGAVQ
jgi:hypothetical protein